MVISNIWRSYAASMEAFHFFKERLQEQEARALPGTRLASHSRTQRRAIWYRPKIIQI